MTEVQYRLTGLSFQVSPSALTVPRGVATQLDVSVSAAESLSSIATVKATLRGPSFPNGMVITSSPTQPIHLPSFAQPGTHFLEDIRLEVNETLTVAANPPAVTINVLDQLLVGAVSSRPLSLDEIRALGIQFDEASFQAFNFTVAFTTQSQVIKLDVPVLVPVGTSQQQLIIGSEIPRLSVPSIPGLELPNLNVQALMLEPIVDLPPDVKIPPIPGIVVIPGNVAFLNQYFSVLLNVTNEAPGGTPLVVRDVRAEIRLPAGGDGVVGDILRNPPFAPGDPEFDNPLRIALTEAGRQNIQPVLTPGPDGNPRTADDIDRLRPQETGMAEFLVEGAREGAHVVDIEIRGTLDGLPSGPVQVAGRARGAVLVRDPNFSLSFVHPDTVRAGELYELVVQLQNTSVADANLVTVSLNPANLSGARLVHAAEASRTIETIAAGDIATLTFVLEAFRTGRVTASTLELSGDTSAVSGRRLSLRTGISEQGVPLSPDTLLLPPAVGRLRDRGGNADLTFRATALLGQAQSIATAPRGSLPPGVLPIGGATVVQRARELSSAAYRLELSLRPGSNGQAEPIPEGLLLTLQDLYFDFLGARAPDDGWDSLYRSSRQARLFGVALAEVLAREAGQLGYAELLALQRSWSDTESYRSDHLSILTQAAGDVPVTVEIADRLGRKLGGSLDPEGGHREIPGADILNFEAAEAVDGQLATLTKPDFAPYTTTLGAIHAGTFDLGIVTPGTDGTLRQVLFRNVAVTAGEKITATIRPRSFPAVALFRGSSEIPATDEQLIPDRPPEILGIVQNAGPSVDRFGRVVGVLFSEDVDRGSAQNSESYGISTATIPMIPPPALADQNRVTNALVQFGDRIVFLGLRDPVGPFVPRTLSASSIRDLRGQLMSPVTGRPILPDEDIGSGAQLTGRVLRADGTPVVGAEISYSQFVEDLRTGLPDLRTITVKPVDPEGRYGLDFVLQNSLGPFKIRARDPVTTEEGSLSTNVRAHGERISLDIVLLGRGSVEGVVRSSDGTPLPNVTVNVTSETDLSSYQTRTDQHGFYRIAGVPVGAIGIEAISTAGRARASRSIPFTGVTISSDITIFSTALGAIGGIVRLPDGTSASNVETLLTLESSGGFLTGTRTDAAGTFQFTDVLPGTYLVRSLDRAAGLIGDTRITVTDLNGPNNPAAVLVVLAGAGSVSGTVFERSGANLVAVPNALVAGGTQIVTADAQGQYLIPSVPVGIRLIEAVNPATGARASRSVTILSAGQASTGINIILEPLATITGRVFDPDGVPVAGQEVRILMGESRSAIGRIFFVQKAQTGPDGTYTFDELEPKSYSLMSVRGTEVANGLAQLSATVLQDVVDLQLARPIGRVSGRVVDETGLAVAAEVSLKARVPNPAGLLEFTDVSSIVSGPETGFTFTGLFPGPFTVAASSFFSPGGEGATASGVLSEAVPFADNLTLTLAKNTGSVRGCVQSPGGAVIAPVLDGMGQPLPLSVFITSARLRDELARDTQNPEPDGIRVDASDGCFESSIALPPDFYTIEVTDNRLGSPTFGLTGQAGVTVERNKEAERNVRLLGLGALAVEVVDASGAALPGVLVQVHRTTYPNDTRDAFITIPTSTSPLTITDLTEGAVAVSATVSTDPGVDVGGREDLRGFAGAATGEVVRDAQRTVRVVIRAAGSVTGRFLRADGVTGVPNAQVELTSPGRPTGFDVTTTDGTFNFNGVPAGNFHLEAFDAATGRRGRADGQIVNDGDRVTQNLILGPLGTVTGVVLDSTRANPIAGADVRLSFGITGTERAVTAGADGKFQFESVPGGPFTLTATSVSGLSGRVEGTLGIEGEVVETTVILEGSGRIEGAVRNALGEFVAGAHVILTDSSGRQTITQAASGAADGGRFVFETVALGPFTVTAQPPLALIPGDGGRTQGSIDSAGQSVVADVSFEGTITIGIVVSGTVGAAPVDVSLQSGGVFGGLAAPTSANGVVLFEGIPRASLTVAAKQTAPAGNILSASATLSIDQLPPAGGRVNPDIQLVLTPVATVSGILLSSAGVPVAGARVTLLAGNVSALSLSGANGEFEFLGIPLDVALRIEVNSIDAGRGVFAGSVGPDGIVRDSAGIVQNPVPLTLDVTPPHVLSVQPPNGAASVPTTSTVVLTFSEPVDVASLRTCTAGQLAQPSLLLLESSATPPQLNDPANSCDDSNVVQASISVSADSRTITLTPALVLKSVTQHTVSVSRGTINAQGALSGGVTDLAGHPLAADFTSRFVTRDDVPPLVLTLSPANGSIGVPEDSVIRVSFSEPIDPVSVDASSFMVNGSAGAVLGVRELILGNTVALFVPTDSSGVRALLQKDGTYTVIIAGVRDVSGNVLRVEDQVAVLFLTRDTVPPVIASMAAPAAVRAGEPFTATASSLDADVASVEFLVDGVVKAVVSAPLAPGQFQATLTMGQEAVTVAARASDTSGNTGPLNPGTVVSLLPDNPPAVTIVAPSAGTVVSPGTTVSFGVRATDDVAVASLRGAFGGAVTDTATQNVSPARTPATASFAVSVPSDAFGGPLTFAVIATDSKGQDSEAAAVTVTVRDDLNPLVSIDAPVPNVVAAPGNSLTVTVTASDAGGVTQVSLEVPELGFDQPLQVIPPAGSVTRSFSVAIPSSFAGTAITLLARAKDRSGHVGTATTRTVAVLSSVPQILTVVPYTARQGQQDLPITVNGNLTHFTNASVVDLGADVTINAVGAINDTTLNVSISVGDAAALGPRTVTVTTDSEVVSLANAFTIAPRVGTVSGVVFESDGITPAMNAAVRAYQGSPLALVAAGTSDGVGQYSIGDVPAGPLRIYAIDEGGIQLGSAAGTITVPGEMINVDLTLSGIGRIEVTVFDIREVPVPDAEVEIRLADFPIPVDLKSVAHRSGSTDANGFLVFDIFPAGKIHATASSTTGIGNGIATLTSGTVVEMAVYLSAGEAFSNLVSLYNGGPLSEFLPPGRNESVSPVVSLYNGAPLSEFLPPGRNESVSPVVSLYNGAPLSGFLPPGRNESVSPVVSLYNGAPLSEFLPPGRNESVSRVASLYNGAPLSEFLPVGRNEANSLLVSLGNGPAFVPTSLSPLILSLEGTASVQSDTASDGPNVSIRITAPPQLQELLTGQTVRVDAEATGAVQRVKFFVNGVEMAESEQAPYSMILTVPRSGSSGLTLHASAVSNSSSVESTPVEVRVNPDRNTVIRGRIVSASGQPVAGASVRIAHYGLQGEYFDFDTQLSGMPDLTQKPPSLYRPVTALNVNNPAGVFGSDPLGLNMRPDFAARYTGWFLVPAAGEYRFALRAEAGATLFINGQRVIEVQGGESEGAIVLADGPAAVEVLHYDNIGTNHLQLFVVPPYGPKQVVPPEALYSESTFLAVSSGADGEFTINDVPLSLGRVWVVAESTAGDLAGVSGEIVLGQSGAGGAEPFVVVPVSPRR